MEVINWFKELKNRNRLNFVIFDIEGFYPAITPKLLNTTLEWAMAYVNVTPPSEENHLSSLSVIPVLRGDAISKIGQMDKAL